MHFLKKKYCMAGQCQPVTCNNRVGASIRATTWRVGAIMEAGHRATTRHMDLAPKFQRNFMDLDGSPWIWGGSRNFTGISMDLYGSGMDLHGSGLDLGTSFEFHLNFMNLGWISMELAWISEFHLHVARISCIWGASPWIWGGLGTPVEFHRHVKDLGWISMDLG